MRRILLAMPISTYLVVLAALHPLVAAKPNHETTLLVSSSSSSSMWDDSWSTDVSPESPPRTADEILGDMEDFPADDEAEETKEVTKKAPPKKNTEQPYASDDEPWRKKDDWWKDPLSMFDDDNDEFVEEVVEEETEPAAVEDLPEDEQDTLEAEAIEIDRETAPEEQDKPIDAKASKRKAKRDEKKEQDITETEPVKSNGLSSLIAKPAFMKKMNMPNMPWSEDSPLKESKAPEKATSVSKRFNTEKTGAGSLALLGGSLASFKTLALNGSLLASSLPVMKVVAAMAAGKVVIESVIRKSKASKNSNFQTPEDELFEEEYNNVIMSDTMEFHHDESRYSDDYEEDLTDEYAHEETDVETFPSVSPSSAGSSATVGEATPTYSSSVSPSIVTGIKSVFVGGSSRPINNVDSGGFLSRKVKVTAGELENLKMEADQAVAQRQLMEQEYEKTSFQLQEAQSEVKQLASTTKYLKTQLKDYEEMMDRTIRNERQKAKFEVQKMKQAMEATRERELTNLKREFLKELDRYQTQNELQRTRLEEAEVAAAAQQQQQEQEKQTANEYNNTDADLGETEEYEDVTDEYHDSLENDFHAPTPTRKRSKRSRRKKRED